jgi:hypothetical protein
MNVSGSSPLSSTRDVDVKAFCNQEFTRPNRRAEARRRRGRSSDTDLRREPPQQLGLLWGQRGAARGDRGGRLRLKHLREVEVPSTKTAKPTFRI